jgi:hypothetical protein
MPITVRSLSAQPLEFAMQRIFAALFVCLFPAVIHAADLDTLTHLSALSAEDSLFAHPGKHEVFTPMKICPPMTVGDLAEIAEA